MIEQLKRHPKCQASLLFVTLLVVFAAFSRSPTFANTVYQKDHSTLVFDLTKNISELPEAEKKEQRELASTERVIANLEDLYFKNKLHKGMTLEALITTITGMFDRNNPYFRYKRLAIQGTPDAFYDKNGAIEQFNLLRLTLGLKPRKY